MPLGGDWWFILVKAVSLRGSVFRAPRPRVGRGLRPDGIDAIEDDIAFNSYMQKHELLFCKYSYICKREGRCDDTTSTNGRYVR